MPAIRYRQNQGFVVLQEKPGDNVPILCRDGERRYARWLGFIDVNVAKQLPEATPVKLDIEAYALETFPVPRWEYLKDGEAMQGCLLLNNGVYGVTHSVMPRIVETKLTSSR